MVTTCRGEGCSGCGGDSCAGCGAGCTSSRECDGHDDLMSNVSTDVLNGPRK